MKCISFIAIVAVANAYIIRPHPTYTPTTTEVPVTTTIRPPVTTTKTQATTTTTKTQPPATTTTTTKTSATPLPTFDRFFEIVLENNDYSQVIKDSYMKTLATRGRLYTNFHAVSHPSLPNYIAMISGSTYGIKDDSNYNLNGNTIVDLLEAKGISWKTYQENYPGNCYTGDNGLYRRKHNPFMSFNNIRQNSARCSKIVNSGQLSTDIANQAVPQYVFYTPNMNNDGHDTSISYLSNFLKGLLEPMLANSYFANTLFLITFDEDESYSNNQIYTAAIGRGATAGTVDGTYYTHYSVLGMLEKRWSLGNLGQGDASATPLVVA